MHFKDNGEQLQESDSEREYFVYAEIYISNAAGISLPKYKKQEDSRSKDSKSSWLGFGKGPAGSGHWRPAICKLTKEASESILFQTVYIHLLRQTDIRPVDNSLFFRKDCVAIYSTQNQRWTAGGDAEHVYLQFPKPELRNLWISLLRSFAVPEIYGRWLTRSSAGAGEREGGSYRMWREVQLTVAQGRNLGIRKVYDPSQDPDDAENEVELKDVDVYCDILLNSVVCAHTTLKKGLGLPEWHESFTFSDLPPFESLEIKIWKEKKFPKPSMIGKVTIDLVTFRRGEFLEGWYPVQNTYPPSQLQLGELRLKVRVSEEIILPHTSYTVLQQESIVLNTRNLLLWMHDLENKLHVKNLLQHLTHLAIVQETIVQQIQEAAVWEVEKAITSHQTMFRGNTVFTKTMEKCITWYGHAFLEASIGGVLRRLLAEKVAIEVDPLRSGKSARDVGRHVDLLTYWCKEFWEQIYSAREDCPRELCAILDRIRTLVEENGRKADLSAQMQKQRPWQSVSAFMFLRFIVPGILNPHLFGLYSGLPDPAIQRSLKLIAKVIQSLANLNTADRKEISMAGIRDFIKDNMPRMIEYLTAVSTPKSSMYSNHRFEDPDDRTVLKNLAQRKATLPVLERESVPASPHHIDPPRELAIITSAVIRHSRDINNRTRCRRLDDITLERLCSACFEVEEEALQRVNELVTRLAQERRRASASAAWKTNAASLSTSQSLSSVPTVAPRRKQSISSSHYAPTTTIEIAPPPVQKPQSDWVTLNSSPREHSHISTEVPVDDVITKWESPEPPVPEVSDDGAKRKRSFIIRGIFGSEFKGGGKSRH
ncbi:Rho GTPase activation protein [Macrolepiota fuliginosa MF-IS2]|uniref:Rho GTPase activation protein n=1 Tax=Macrolepiota fuliginosa MF-IS2 TaxID=1400762 RepID=A0A9P6C6A2_9AGAR|nr:Rho GTPase activation protein [Macrolepiota fuliginosa MF-IS2]